LKIYLFFTDSATTNRLEDDQQTLGKKIAKKYPFNRQVLIKQKNSSKLKFSHFFLAEQQLPTV